MGLWPVLGLDTNLVLRLNLDWHTGKQTDKQMQ